MKEQTRLQIKEFSKLSGIKKDNLRFYDKIGLLSPQLRGENGYRYYSPTQLNTAFLILDLRSINVSLEEIKTLMHDRSPEQMIQFLENQKNKIEHEINQLRSKQELMNLRVTMALSALDYKKDTIVIEEKEAETIYICTPVFSHDEDDWVEFYDDAYLHGVDTTFPAGTIFPKESFLSGDRQSPSCHYFKVTKRYNAEKPKGTYAVFYGKWNNSTPLTGYYDLFIEYIKKNDFILESDFYEEYPLDGLFVKDNEDYGLRIEVKVSKRISNE